MIRTLLSILLFSFTPAAVAETITGTGRGIDGDSLMAGSSEVRLYGIDAPEFTQTCQRSGRSWNCGSEAAYQLSKLVNGKQVSCTTLGADTHGRTLGRCRAGETDLNRTMVATGYALAYRRYSMDYVSAEESAKLAKRGIWTSTFELPSQVRHAGEDYVLEQSTDRGTGGALPVVSSPRSGFKQRGATTGSSNQRKTPFKNCAAARAAGPTPITRDHPRWGDHLDADGDGRACEPLPK